MIGDIDLKQNSSMDELFKELIFFSKIIGIHQIKYYSVNKGELFEYLSERKNNKKVLGLPIMIKKLNNNVNLTKWLTNIADYNTF